MAIVELVVATIIIYGSGCLWPNVTLATLSFALGLAFAQYNPNMPRVGSLLHSAKLGIARLLSRSDDLGTSISDIAASTVRMTAAQAKAIIEREREGRLPTEAVQAAVAAVTKPAKEPTEPVKPAAKPAAPAADKPTRVSFKDRLVQFEN